MGIPVALALLVANGVWSVVLSGLEMEALSEAARGGLEDTGLIPGSTTDQIVMVNLVSALSIAYTAFKTLAAVAIFGVVWVIRLRRGHHNDEAPRKPLDSSALEKNSRVMMDKLTDETRRNSSGFESHYNQPALVDP